MKKTTLLLLTLLGLLTLNAQDDYWKKIREENLNRTLFSNEDFFNKAELVVEGRFLKSYGSYDAKGNYNPNDLYTVQTILVQRVYKGDPKWINDTLYIVRHGGTIYQYFDEDTWAEIRSPGYHHADDHGVSIGKDNSSILFFIKSDFPDNPIKSEYSEQVKYRFLQDKEMAILGVGRKISGLNNLIFNNREELYNYMQQFKGYTVPDVVPNIVPEQPQYLPVKTIINYKDAGVDSLQYEMMKSLWGGDKKKVTNNVNKSSPLNSLTLKLDNQQVVYNDTLDKYFLKFDVLASSNQSLYYDGSNFRLGYDTILFGSNIVGNGKVYVTAGNNFNNGDDYTIWNTYDMSSIYNVNNGIVVVFGVNGTHQNRVLLGSVPTSLLHFQIELLPNLDSVPSQLVFRETYYTSHLSTYTLTSNAPFGVESIAYDTTFYINSDTIYVSTTGSPFITTDLSVLSKTAGTGDTLTIRGYRFGNDRGSLLFTNSENGGTTFLKGLDEQYYITWSDTLINVLVPSLVYEGYTELDVGGAGTGPIKIKTATGDSCISSTSLYIPTSVLNTRFQDGSPIHRVYLARENCDYDFQFTLHRHYQYDTEKIAVIDSALHHWSALTGLTMILEYDTTGNLVFVDSTSIANKNIIYPYADATTTLMTTRSGYRRIIMNGDTIFYRHTGSNIGIKDNPSLFSWNYEFSGTVPAGELSFYNTFMHELGHILLLGHVIAPSQLMHYATSSGIPIMNLDISDTTVIAANQNIEASQTINWTTTSGLKKIKVPAKPIITVIPDGQNVSCNGSPVTLSASNILPSNILQWKNNGTLVGSTNPINVTNGGIYNVTVTNSIDNCILTSNPIEVVSSILSADFDVTPPYYDECGELGHGAVDVTISETSTHPPFSFLWHNGATTEDVSNLSAEEPYSVNITNNIGCSINYSPVFAIQIGFIQPMQVEVFNNGCNAFVNVNGGGSHQYSCLWQILYASDTVPTTISTTDTADITCSREKGVITVTVTDDRSGCSQTIDVTCCDENKRSLAIGELQLQQPILYPNPTTGEFQIKEIQKADIQIFDLTGKFLYAQKNISESSEINLDNVSNGVYLVKIIEKENVFNLRLVIEK